MAKPVGSMGPFLEGYREQEQKRAAEKPRAPQATDVLDLFARKGTDRLTLFEISSQLMIAPQEAKRFVDELSTRKLVSIESTREGNDLVTLTKRGKLYTEEQ